MRLDAKDALAQLDSLLAGGPDTETTSSIITAAIFAAAAYEASVDGGQNTIALLRAFLIALHDPLDPRLDYLRATPDAGQTARCLANNDDPLNEIAPLPQADE